MKKLASILIVIIANVSISYAQINYNSSNIEFSIEVEDGAILLNWEIEREVNTSYFLVERSDGKGEYEVISRVKAGSSTFQRTTYEFEDVTNSDDFHRYRITLVYMDGTSISALPESKDTMNVADDLGN